MSVDPLAIGSGPLDGVSPRWVIIDHRVDTVGDKYGPFVVLLIRGRKSKAPWESWVNEKSVHEYNEVRLLDYWQKLGGRDAQAFRNICPLRVHGGLKRREGKEGTEYLVQYVGYPNDDDINQWEPEEKVLEQAVFD